MRKFVLITAAAVAVAASAAGIYTTSQGTTSLASPAAQVAAQQAHHRTVCNWLRDGKGTGSALSALPGQTPRGGQQATVQNIGNAWTVCYNGGTGAIWLESDPGLCATATDGIVAWDGCGQAGQVWNAVEQPGGGAEYRFHVTGGGLDICATDGVGSKVIAAGRSACSVYHRVYLFSQAARKR